MQPLSNYRVLSFGQAWAAPYADMMLADMGADVVKLEPPGTGDHVRKWSRGDLHGLSPHLLAVNRNKRGIVVDLKSAEGQALALKLIGQADVLIENFSPGTMTSLGLDYAAVGQHHARLVYCSVSGFGNFGPYASRPAYDMVMQGEGGLISVTGTEDGQQAKVGAPVLDVMTAMVAAYSIVCALMDRAATGTGRYLDIAMLETAASAMGFNLIAQSMTGDIARPMGTAHPLVAPYQVYSTRTAPISVAILTEAHWKVFCKLIGREDLLTNPLFLSAVHRIDNRVALNEVLMPIIREQTAEYWMEEFGRHGLVGGAVNDVAGLLRHPQLRARKFFFDWKLDNGISVAVPGMPWQPDGRDEPVRRLPPRLGEHTEEVLAEWLRMDPASIASLKKAGAIASAV